MNKIVTYANLLNIIAKAPGHIYWKNNKGIYQGSNDAQAIFLGYKTGKDLIGKTDFDLFWKNQAIHLQKNDNYVMETKKEHCVEEIVNNRNGVKSIFLTRKMPLFNSNNEVIGIIGTSIDITGSKQAELAKEEFIMNMAHDLRTPFSGIVGLAQLQEMGTLKTPEDVKDYGKLIYESGNQLLEILNAVIVALEKNRIYVINAENVDLYQFSIEIQALIMPVIYLNKLDFVLDVDPAIGEIFTDKF